MFEYAVVRAWKGNPTTFAVIEYFCTMEEGLDYIAKQKDSQCNWEVRKCA
jgi:hypothetical protein